jgi:hypothetical protein
MTYSETHMVLVKKQETRNQDDTYDEILDDKLASKECVKRHSLTRLTNRTLCLVD